MPKVNLKRDAPLNKVALDFYKYIRSRYPRQKFYKIIGYKNNADSYRVNNPEELKLGELRVLYREGEEVFPREALDEMFLNMIREVKK